MKGNLLKWISQKKYANLCLLQHDVYILYMEDDHTFKITNLYIFHFFIVFPKGAKIFIIRIFSSKPLSQTCKKFFPKAFAQYSAARLFYFHRWKWLNVLEANVEVISQDFNFKLKKKNQLLLSSMTDGANWNFLYFIFTARKLRK